MLVAWSLGITFYYSSEKSSQAAKQRPRQQQSLVTTKTESLRAKIMLDQVSGIVLGVFLEIAGSELEMGRDLRHAIRESHSKRNCVVMPDTRVPAIDWRANAANTNALSARCPHQGATEPTQANSAEEELDP